jgi:hypothetical protein
MRPPDTHEDVMLNLSNGNHGNSSPLVRLKATSLALIASVVLFGTTTFAAEAPEPSLEIKLRPLARNGTIAGLAVEETMTGISASPSSPLLQLALVVYNVPTAAKNFVDLTARDASGPLELTSRDEGTGPSAVRRWLPNRSTAGTVHVNYKVTQANELAPMGAAPPTELRIEDGALSAGAATIIARPAVASLRLSIAWDLRELPGSIGIDSLSNLPRSGVSSQCSMKSS